MTNWVNSDGLLVRFGTAGATALKGGTLPGGSGPYEVYECTITATDLGTAATIQDYTVRFPSGARIMQVDVISEVACTSGGSAALNIGFKRATDFSTEVDHDGLVAALALTAINADGEVNELRVGSSGAGALVGTVLAHDSVLTADYDTAAFTAGRLKIRVHVSNAG